MPLSTLEFTENLARQAGQLLLSYYRSPELVAELKADYSPVTQADRAADALIHAAIRAAYPEDAILSEEYQTRLDSSSRVVWVIDPLDGTINFTAGTPIWGVSIARCVDGAPETGAIYFPVMDELYSTQQGAGAWLDGRPLQDFAAPPVRMAAVCSRTPRHYKIHPRFKLRMFGAVTYNLMLVARRQMSFNLEAQPRLWDFAAGWLIVAESGGVMHILAGGPPFPLQTGMDYGEYAPSLLAAASPELLQEALAAIQAR